MRILYFIHHRNGMGADRWIGDGWCNAFRDLGHEFEYLTVHEDWMERVDAWKPDLLMLANLVDIPRTKETLKAIRARGVKVLMILDWFMSEENRRILREEEIADCFYGEKEPESMRWFEEATGRKYHLVANAADKLLHFPAKPEKKYAYDIAFLGANLPQKRYFFDEVLRPLSKRYRVGLFGPRWTMKDDFLAAVQAGFKRIGASRASSFVNRWRITLPPQDENKLYASAKISLNFHEREKDGSQPNYILNQRTFKIPACGGFEICDEVPALRKYFAPDEVVTAKTSADFLTKVDYYMQHEAERKRIQEKGTARALREHTFHNRVEEVFRILASSAAKPLQESRRA